MKITQVMFSQGWGGAERLLIDLAGALAASGCQLQVICRPGFEKMHLLQNHPNITCSTMQARGNWDLYALASLHRRIRAFGPDLIHTHLARATWMGGRVGKRLGVPVLTTTHNYIKYKYFRNIPWFSATTADQGRYLIAQGIAPERIQTIPNFSTFKPAGKIVPCTSSCPHMVSLGRFVKKKGFATLLHAFNQYVQQHGDARLTLGGSGPEAEYLKAQVVALGLEKKIQFKGWIEDVRAFLIQSDLFVLPSLDEPFGIAVLEAMACGKPMILTRSKGPLEIVDQTCAYFADPGDAASLRDAMVELIGEPNTAAAKANKALQLYRQQYHSDAVVPKTLAYYATIIQSSQ